MVHLCALRSVLLSNARPPSNRLASAAPRAYRLPSLRRKPRPLLVCSLAARFPVAMKTSWTRRGREEATDLSPSLRQPTPARSISIAQSIPPCPSPTAKLTLAPMRSSNQSAATKGRGLTRGGNGGGDNRVSPTRNAAGRLYTIAWRDLCRSLRPAHLNCLATPPKPHLSQRSD